MFKRLVPASLIAATLAGTFTVTTIAAGDDDGSCPPPTVSHTESGTDAPATSGAGSESPATPAPDGRCAIDAEAYFLAYEASAMYTPSQASTQELSPPPMVLDPAGDDTPVSDGPPIQPVVPGDPDEPGLLDDNTFVDTGDSRWVETDNDRESTFGLDVDTGSYNVAQTFLAGGYRPEPDSIRPEEWINSFGYGDEPAVDSDLGITVQAAPGEGAGDPTLVRVGVTSRELTDAERPPANITFVIDTSGSMDIRERLGLVQSSLALLVRSLRTDDTISIVTYGDFASPVLAPTPIAEWPRILDAIDSLAPSGSTNMESGLLLGYEQARATFDPEALNVVVLASDGVANQGVTDADVLTSQITQAGEEGIHLVTVGYGMGNYNDQLMEQLADQGDGFYSYVDTFAEAVGLFVDDLTPTLTVVAEEAKVQVVFDDEVVARYRLIGYANRALDDSQFRDDTVDAGEIGAGHQVSAVYEVELVDGAAVGPDTELAEVRLRWRSTDSGEVIELDTPLHAFDGESDSAALRLAALVAHTAEVLRGDDVVTERGITLETLLAEAQQLEEIGVDGADEMVEMISVAIHAQPAAGS